MDYPTQLLIRDGITALQENDEWFWNDGRYERDYSTFHRVGGIEILKLREDAHGSMMADWIPTLEITRKGSQILHQDGTLLRLSHIKQLGRGSRVQDFVSWQWVEGHTLQFQPRRHSLTLVQQSVFRLLCDTLVANFPGITRRPATTGHARTYNIDPNTDVEWTLAHGRLHRYEGGRTAAEGAVTTQPELTHLTRAWRGKTAWWPSRRYFHRSLGRRVRQEGFSARGARAQKWRDVDEGAAAAFESVSWSSFVNQPGLTTYDTQLWTRLRHSQLRVWGRGDNGGACARARCSGREPASPLHITWSCPRAKELWPRLLDLWGAEPGTEASLQQAVFARRPPPSGYDWQGELAGRDSVQGDRLHYWLHIVWAQLVTCAIQRLWTRSVGTAMGTVTDKDDEDYRAAVHHYVQKLRGNLPTVVTAATDTKDIDTRVLRRILRLALKVEAPVWRPETPAAYVLFFDGGRRGNPGPGGNGSVIVRVGDATELVWAAAMAYSQATTTNNIAEYHGLCQGLKAAEQHGFHPLEVVGDSMMIIRQMISRHRPKAPLLRPLYEQARSTADALRVRHWHHHYRSHNKMADKAANQAMDRRTSYQASADSGRPELDELREWLSNDVQHWFSSRPPPAGAQPRGYQVVNSGAAPRPP